jgi:carboxymethylenebutenolidase
LKEDTAVTSGGQYRAEHNYIGAETSWEDIAEGTRAFLAMPRRGAAPYGAVILGHERYGLVQHTLDLAAKFASYGYICIAPDMASHWDGDKAALNRGEVRLSLTQDEIKFYYSICLDHLLRMPNVDKDRIASMGVCASGSYPLYLNSIRDEVCANLIFYGGSNTSDEVIAVCKAPIMAVWGEKDHTTSIEDIERFRDRLEKLNKSYDILVIREGPHGFLNDTMPGRYRQPEAEESWQFMIDFLDRVHHGGYPAGRVRQRFQADIAADYDFSKNVRLE